MRCRTGNCKYQQKYKRQTLWIFLICSFAQPVSISFLNFSIFSVAYQTDINIDHNPRHTCVSIPFTKRPQLQQIIQQFVVDYMFRFIISNKSLQMFEMFRTEFELPHENAANSCGIESVWKRQIDPIRPLSAHPRSEALIEIIFAFERITNQKQVKQVSARNIVFVCIDLIDIKYLNKIGRREEAAGDSIKQLSIFYIIKLIFIIFRSVKMC